MNWLIFHIASGHAFFAGAALICVAALISLQPKPILKRLALLAFVLGTIAVAISSTAIPYWYYGFAAVVAVAWAISLFVQRWQLWMSIAVVAVWMTAAAIEVPYHITPTLHAAPSQSVTIIGDSVTAGIGRDDKSVRWPAILAERHNLRVQDISHMGETAGSALKRARQGQIESPVVIVEIGGNDLLGRSSAAQFAQDLDALLTYVSTPDRQVVMFELPLPPFHHEYGRIQRRLAREHNVSLVPKRVLLSVLTAAGATLDSIHLTQSGHRQMADRVWQFLREAFPET